MTEQSTATISDEDIIRQVLNGDIDAFERLLKRYQGHVLKIVKKHVPPQHIEETTQEVFIQAYQSLNRIKKPGSFRQWLSAIAIRACYDFWRKRYRSKEIPVSDLSAEHQDWLMTVISDQSDDIRQEKGRQQEARELLDWSLSRLSPKDRMALELVYLEGHTIKEAAKLLGWSTTNVKVRAHRSRKKIHKLLLTTRRYR